MASLIPNILPKDTHSQIIVTGASIAILIGVVFVATFAGKKTPKNDDELSTWSSFVRFFYACFLKPHEKSGENGQQDALESFYKAQAGVYDATRKRLLCGREDMLGLVAAQLKQKATADQSKNQRRIWVDVSTAACLSQSRQLMHSISRLAAEQATTSRPCQNTYPSPSSSPASTSSISRPRCAKWRGRDLSALDGTM